MQEEIREMNEYVNPIDFSYEWMRCKDLIIKFNFSGKWEFDYSTSCFIYCIGITCIQVDETHAWFGSIIMNISDFDKDKFKNQVLEKYPTIIWPTEK